MRSELQCRHFICLLQSANSTDHRGIKISRCSHLRPVTSRDVHVRVNERASQQQQQQRELQIILNERFNLENVAQDDSTQNVSKFNNALNKLQTLRIIGIYGLFFNLLSRKWKFKFSNLSNPWLRPAGRSHILSRLFRWYNESVLIEIVDFSKIATIVMVRSSNCRNWFCWLISIVVIAW